MNITIKPLTPKLAAEYFDFFENRAFADDSPYRCYCQIFQMSKAEHKAECDKLDELDPAIASRKLAEQQIETGALQGYLAYIDDVSIGWCNANNRANYPADPQFDVPFHAPAESREMAVVCFEIAPNYRGKGVATALLQRVIADAATEGYIAVIGFPVTRDERYEWDHHGPMRLYEKAGFVKMSEQNGFVTMRKELF